MILNLSLVHHLIMKMYSLYSFEHALESGNLNHAGKAEPWMS